MTIIPASVVTASIHNSSIPTMMAPGNEVQLGFNVGTRGNGKDAPKWPSDLMTEVVA